MSYYDNRESVVNIYKGLVNRGWNCYGYRADESDSMTDYFSPASWAGIAEKNGFVLLVDVYGTSNSGYKVTKQTYTPDYSKIEKLNATINDKAATPNEKAASQKIIDNMMNKENESTTIIEEYPTFTQANPKGCNWHIEKDGCIIAKGKGAYQCDGYLFGGYEKETMVKVNKFIDKIEKYISGKDQLVPVQEEVVKVVTKPVEVKVVASEFVKDQTIIKLNASFTGGHGKGTLLQLVEINEYNNKTRYTFVKLGKKFQQLKRFGATNNTITFDSKNVEKWISDSSILVMELKEVEEVTYKTVYKKATRQGQNSNLLATEVVEEVATTQEAPEQAETVITNNESLTVELITNEEKNGLELKFNGKPSEETRNLLKENRFKWSRYSKVWYIKNNVTNLNFAEAFVSAFNDNPIEEVETAYNSEPAESLNDLENDSTFIYAETMNNNIDLQYFAQETKEVETMDSLDSILSKFDNITIENDERISPADKEYCELKEAKYNSALSIMKQCLSLYNSIYDPTTDDGYRSEDSKGYIDKHYDIKHTEERIDKIKNEFISDIMYYFEKTYNVTLAKNEVKQKFDSDLTYENIIDEVFEQLGGFNFTEKAITEIKEASRNTIYRDDKISINKGKISIIDYIYWDNSWDNKYKKLGYSDTKVRTLFAALSHYETGNTDTLYYYDDMYNEFYRGSQDFDIFSKYTLGHNKVNSFKNFKNGKIEIEFQTNEQAQEFVSNYLIG